MCEGGGYRISSARITAAHSAIMAATASASDRLIRDILQALGRQHCGHMIDWLDDAG